MPPVLLGIPWPALRGLFWNHFWKKRRPGGENSGNALESQMPWIIGFGRSQPYSWGEFQETLWERFRGLFRVFLEFLPGKSQPYWAYGPWEGSHSGSAGGDGLHILFFGCPKTQQEKGCSHLPCNERACLGKSYHIETLTFLGQESPKNVKVSLRGRSWTTIFSHFFRTFIGIIPCF